MVINGRKITTALSQEDIGNAILLAEFARLNHVLNYRLAVIDTEDTTDINVWNESMTVLEPVVFYRVVKMEGE